MKISTYISLVRMVILGPPKLGISVDVLEKTVDSIVQIPKTLYPVRAETSQ